MVQRIPKTRALASAGNALLRKYVPARSTEATWVTACGTNLDSHVHGNDESNGGPFGVGPPFSHSAGRGKLMDHSFVTRNSTHETPKHGARFCYRLYIARAFFAKIFSLAEAGMSSRAMSLWRFSGNSLSQCGISEAKTKCSSPT
jgi:hypothetical protein